MKQKEIVILIGNIGSGKSTYAREYQGKGYVVISRDQLRYGIGGGNYVFNYNYEPIIWKTELYLFKKFIDLGVNAVVDEVGITKEVRKRYMSYAKKRGYKIIGIEMPRISMKKSVNRRMKDPHGQYDRKLWESVWKRIDFIYEKPIKDEGFNKIRRLK